MSSRYSLFQIDRLRGSIRNPRRMIAAAVPALVLVVVAAAIRHQTIGLRIVEVTAAVALVWVAIRSYQKPSFMVAAYDRAHANWDRLLDLSDPRTPLTLDFSPRRNEIPYYSEMSTRFDEPRDDGRQAIPGSHVDPNAMLNARARFGKNGSVYYDPKQRGGRRRKLPPGVKRVVPIDAGRLTITSHRFLFEGVRYRIELPITALGSYRAIENAERIAVDHPGRSPSESFTVDPILFCLAMVRRANDPRFHVPGPPPPLADDRALSVELPSPERLIS